VTALDVFVVGGVGVDTVVRVPALPLPAADSIVVPPIADHVGHTGNGVALGCHALGLRTAIADVIGDDDNGRLIRRAYAGAGLELAYRTHPSGTRRSVNLVDGLGRRLSLYDPRHPDDLDLDPTLYEAGIGRAGHVHVTIMHWARRALAAAVAAGRPTSTDLHDWDGDDDYHRDFAEGADLVFLSTASLGGRADEVAAGILDRGRAAAVVAMAGADGCRLTVRGELTRAFPAVSLAGVPVVDSNGAGDSFVAAFLFARLRGASWERATMAGLIAGAYACGSAGTHSAFIGAERLRAELVARPAPAP
jgi:sugar/nucleoside kinase (ribokinase family)